MPGGLSGDPTALPLAPSCLLGLAQPTAPAKKNRAHIAFASRIRYY
jgi:hypothetical protein